MTDSAQPATAAESLDEGTLESILENSFGEQRESEPEPAPEEQEAQAEQDDELGPDDLDEADPKPSDAGAAFEIVHNGQTVKLSRDEVIENARKGFDYTQKTMALSETQKAYQQGLQRLQELEQVQPMLAQEMAQVSALQMRLQDERYSDQEMLRLAQSGDILEYQQREAERNILRNQFQSVAGQFQQKASAVQQYRSQLMATQLEQEAARLPEVIPQWKDPAKMNADKAEIARYLQNLGADMGQIGRYLDNALAMKIVLDASRYQRLGQLKADKSKQLRAAPPVIKPGAAAPSDQGKANFAKARTAIRQAGQKGQHRAQEQILQGLLDRTFRK